MIWNLIFLGVGVLLVYWGQKDLCQEEITTGGKVWAWLLTILGCWTIVDSCWGLLL